MTWELIKLCAGLVVIAVGIVCFIALLAISCHYANHSDWLPAIYYALTALITVTMTTLSNGK